MHARYVRQVNPGFVVIDFDNTVIYNDCMESLMAWMVRHGYANAQQVFLQYHNLLAVGKVREAYIHAARMLDGLFTYQLEDMVWAMLEEDGTDVRPSKLCGISIPRGIAVRKNVFRIMERLHAGQVDLYYVSASPQRVVEATKKYLAAHTKGCELLDEIKVIGLRNVVSKNKIVTGELIPPLSMFEDKVACIRDRINKDERPLGAIGDSKNDRAMLECADVKGVVDRENELAEIAADHIARGETDWELIRE